MNCNRCNLRVCTRSDCDVIPLRCVRYCPNCPNCLIPCGVFKLLFFPGSLYYNETSKILSHFLCARRVDEKGKILTQRRFRLHVKDYQVFRLGPRRQFSLSKPPGATMSVLRPFSASDMFKFNNMSSYSLPTFVPLTHRQ